MSQGSSRSRKGSEKLKKKKGGGGGAGGTFVFFETDETQMGKFQGV